MGLTINVEWRDDLQEKDDAHGMTEYRQNRILMQNTSRPKEIVEQYFYHELVHWILFLMGEDDLQRDEKFVDLFAHLLYQALNTMEE